MVNVGLPSRFGSFEIFKSRDEHTGRAGPSVGRDDIRLQMLDYVISTFYPEIQASHPGDHVQRHAAFFREVSGGGPLRVGAGCPALLSPPLSQTLITTHWLGPRLASQMLRVRILGRTPV